MTEQKLEYFSTDSLQSNGLKNINQSLSNEANEPSSSSKNIHTDDLILQAKRNEIFTYSREGNFKDTKKRLKDALDTKIISQKEYYGELAHMLSVPIENPEIIIKEIVTSSDKYGFEVMISLLSGNNFMAESLPESVKKQIHDDVYNSKPEITGLISNLVLTDIYIYENWIGTLRTFSKNDDDFIKNLNEIISNKITDPREAFGMHSTIKNNNFLEKLNKEAKYKYLYYINNYIASYPANEVAPYINSRQ
ncbi:MAG: hypothetical protein RSD57_15230 [Comamonas sp.]